MSTVVIGVMNLPSGRFSIEVSENGESQFLLVSALGLEALIGALDRVNTATSRHQAPQGVPGAAQTPLEGTTP